MTDLFAVEHSRVVPQYGTLTALQERALWDTDRVGWYAYVAEAMAKKLIAGGAESIRVSWPLMSNEYKRALWPHLNDETREIVRHVRATLPQGEPEAIAA